MQQAERGGDDPLVQALRQRDPAERDLDTGALLQGVRRRAARIRTRRRALVGVAAVAVLGVPVGITWGGGGSGGGNLTPAATSPAATPSATAVGPLGTGAMLSSDVLAQTVPGAVRDESADTVEAAGAQVLDAGICTDLPLTGVDPLQAGRTAVWADPRDPAVTFGQSVTETVRVFEGDGARQYVQFARDQLAACAESAPETGPWTTVSDGGDGADDLVAAYAQFQSGAGGTSPLWRVRSVAERDGVVVDVSLEVYQSSPDGLGEQAADLALTGLATAVQDVREGAGDGS